MLTVNGLSKTIDKEPVLVDLSFEMRDGDRLGIIGPNGSGKSLLLAMLATLVKPTKGKIYFDGLDAWTKLGIIRPQIGYLTPTPIQAFEPIQMINLTVNEYLNFYAQAYGINRLVKSDLIQGTLELTDLGPVQNKPLMQLSLGQQTRVLLAKNVLHDPKLWLLDDPLSQMDPNGQTELIELILELGKMKKMVVLSTNHLTAIQKICNRVAILHQGQLAYFGSMPSDLVSTYHRLVKPEMTTNVSS